MDIDPLEIAGQDDEDSSSQENQKNNLNNYVAITIALLATFLGICNVKAGNIAQAMQQAQADKIDYWAWYQARNIREEIAQATAAQLQVQSLGQPENIRSSYQEQILNYQAIAKSQNEKKDKLQEQAEGFQKTYEQLNVHDDQFDLSEASLSLAIALLAMTSLLQKRWLFYVALLPTGFGVFMGLAGLLSLNIKIDPLTQLLSRDPAEQQLAQTQSVTKF